MAASLKDWPKAIRQCYENTVPGGWVEVQDFDLQYYSEDGSMTKESAVSEWANTLLKACQSFGCDPFPGPKIGGYLQDVGFQNIKAERFHIPIGPWPKDPHLVRFCVESQKGLVTQNLERPPELTTFSK